MVVVVFCILELNKKSPKVGIKSSLMESPTFVTSNTCLSNLQLKSGREVVFLYFGTKKIEAILSFLFLSFIQFEEHTSGERGKEMHVHIGGKENEKILSHVKIKHVCT